MPVRKIAWLLMVLASSFLWAQKVKDLPFHITGVSPKVQANINKRLKELEQTKPLKTLSKKELREQIIKAIQPFGYFKAQINIEDNVNIIINSGPRVTIASVHLSLVGEGANNPLLTKTMHEAPLHEGEPLLFDEYLKLKQTLTNTAENSGYLHANFEKASVLIDLKKNNAVITLLFNTGPLFYFGQVQFDPTYIRPELLHRYVPFVPGQAYSNEKILKLNNDLSGSGYFSSVLVNPQIKDTQDVPVQVHLQAVSKYSYSLSAGYGTDTGIRGRAGLHIIPVNRSGHKFNALAQGSQTQNALQAQYIVPGNNPVSDQYSLTSNFSSLNYTSGYSNALLLSLAQDHHVDYFKRILSINGLYESFHYAQQPNTNQLLLYPKATFKFNNTKNQLFTPTGYQISFNTLGANQAMLSEINFAQASVDARGAWMIEPLRLRLYGHVIEGLTVTNNINQLPLSLALLLGGTDNLKGYSFNSIGPGKRISYAGFEVQKETLHNWYLLGFYDVGDVFNPTFKNNQYDVGIGLMWVSPLGPIKVGVAQAIDQRFARIDSHPRLVISMGPDL